MKEIVSFKRAARQNVGRFGRLETIITVVLNMSSNCIERLGRVAARTEILIISAGYLTYHFVVYRSSAHARMHPRTYARSYKEHTHDVHCIAKGTICM